MRTPLPHSRQAVSRIGPGIGIVRIVIPTNTLEVDADFTPDDPAWGYASINFRFESGEAADTIARARKLLEAPLQPTEADASASEDPEIRLDELIQDMIHGSGSALKVTPAIISVAGNIDPAAVLSGLKTAFGNLKTTKASVATAVSVSEKSRTVALPGKPQSEFGYLLAAPAPSDPASYAYRLLLYIMAHDYEGRLGKELIGRKGLIYYIGSDYHSNGLAAWISMTFGVDPDKLHVAQEAFQRVMNDLREHPPTTAEVEEAKESIIGRRMIGNQSNEKLSAFYARELIEQGRLLSDAELEKRVRSVTPDQVLKIIPQFLNGSTAIIDTN